MMPHSRVDEGELNMTFRIGQKVVCVGIEGTPRADWSEWPAYYKIVKPERGPVYTVRDSRIGANGRQHIRLVEIVNPPAKFIDAPDQEPWWWAEGFRPVVERKTSIEIFTKLLADNRVDA
jgi:hypothetical protein